MTSLFQNWRVLSIVYGFKYCCSLLKVRKFLLNFSRIFSYFFSVLPFPIRQLVCVRELLSCTCPCQRKFAVGKCESGQVGGGALIKLRSYSFISLLANESELLNESQAVEWR